MKKKIIIFILCVCFIIPAMFCLSACSQPHFSGLVDMINKDQIFAKNHFNSLIEKTTREDFEISYNGEDNKIFCSNTKKYIYEKTENDTQYLMLYQIWSSEIYILCYNENDTDNANMTIMNSNQDTDYEYSCYVKNHLHAIYDIESVTAKAKEDSYFMYVEFKDVNYTIQYHVQNDKIRRISYDNKTIDLIYYPIYVFDDGVNAEPFYNIKTLWIEENINITKLDELFLQNIETIYIRDTIEEFYCPRDFMFIENSDGYNVYQKNSQ